MSHTIMCPSGYDGAEGHTTGAATCAFKACDADGVIELITSRASCTSNGGVLVLELGREAGRGDGHLLLGDLVVLHWRVG